MNTRPTDDAAHGYHCWTRADDSRPPSVGVGPRGTERPLESRRELGWVQRDLASARKPRVVG